MINVNTSTSQERNKLKLLKTQAKTRCVILTRNKKAARKIKESFEICKIANSFVVKQDVKDLNLHDKDLDAAQMVLLDADCYPDRWDKIVQMANELPSVKRGGVIVLSSFGDTDILMKAKNAGAMEFIVKPFDLFGMFSLIKKLKGFSFQIVKTGEAG